MRKSKRLPFLYEKLYFLVVGFVERTGEDLSESLLSGFTRSLMDFLMGFPCGFVNILA